MEIKINFATPPAKLIFFGSLVAHFISLLLAWRVGTDAQFSYLQFGYSTTEYSLNGFETNGWFVVLLVVALPGYYFFRNKPFSKIAYKIAWLIPVIILIIQLWLMLIVVSDNNISSGFEYSDDVHFLGFRAAGRWVFVGATMITLYSLRRVGALDKQGR